MGVLMVAAIAILSLASLSQEKPSRRLPDGSRLTLERVYFGTDESFFAYKEWKQKIPEWTPKIARRLIGPNGSQYRGQRDQAELICWFSWPGQSAGQVVPADNDRKVRIVDEHGCVFKSTSTEYDGDSDIAEVHGFSFASFPRRSDLFQVQILENEALVAEFEVTNPAKAEFPVWQPHPLPARREQNGLGFELRKLSLAGQSKSSAEFWLEGNAPRWAARISVSRDGSDQPGWRVIGLQTGDATGNPGPDLCIHESAWKIQAELARPADGQFAPSETWSLGRLAVPGDGQMNMLGLSNQLAGVPVTIQGFGGPGVYIYSNRVFVAVKPIKPIDPGNSQFPFSTYPVCSLGANPVRTDRQTLPHLEINLDIGFGANSDIVTGHVLTLRGKDNEGRPVLYETRLDTPFPIMAILNLQSDAQFVDLELIIHHTEQVSFLVKPPSDRVTDAN